MRILVVDNDPSIINEFANTLKAVGHHVVTTAFRTVAISHIENEQFHIVIANLRIFHRPGDISYDPKGGIDVLLAAKQARPVPTIILTTAGLFDEATRKAAETLNIEHVLEKPVELIDLLKKIGVTDQKKDNQ